MTPRERWLAVFQRKKPDRLPMEHWATVEANERLVEYLGCKDIDEALETLHVDRVVGVGGKYVGPRLAKGKDVYGCRLREVRYATGVYEEVVYSPLAEYDSVREIRKNYEWPDPDWWDYSDVERELKGKQDLPIRAGGCWLLMYFQRLRGQWQSYVDLVRHPDIVEYCLDELLNIALEGTRRIYERIPGQVMMTEVAEDLGHQSGLLMPPSQIRRFVIPRVKEIIDIAHEEGAFVFHHDDGAVREILPDMIKAGIDILNPVQWRCRGMDREGLKRGFGQALVFHGAMDNQHTLPFGSVADVEREVGEHPNPRKGRRLHPGPLPQHTGKHPAGERGGDVQKGVRGGPEEPVEGASGGDCGLDPAWNKEGHTRR